MRVFPGAVARLAGLSAPHAPLFGWLAGAVVLSAVFVYLSALMNALGEVGKLAVLQVAAPASMALLALPTAVAARQGREQPLVLILVLSTAAAVAAAALLLWNRHEDLRTWFGGRGGWWSNAALRRFFSISGAMLASGLISSLTLVAIRARIVRLEGLTAAGEFDAAWTISMNHVTLVLASLQSYYLPLLARTREAGARAAQISAVLVPAALTAACVIAGIALLKAWILGLLYSHEFVPAARYLRWTLLGDYLKVTSWILSVPMLASADMEMFLAADVAAWSAFAAGAWVFSIWKTPAESAAMAFAGMYVVHALVSAAYVWRRHAFSPDRRTWVVWGSGLGLVAATSGWNWTS